MKVYDLKIIIDRLCEQGCGEFEVVFRHEGENLTIQDAGVVGADPESFTMIIYSKSKAGEKK